MKLIALSDMHGRLPWNIDTCDVVVIAGDILPLPIQWSYINSMAWLRSDFIPWVKKLACDKVILIAGNHDILFDPTKYPEDQPELYDDFINLLKSCDKITYLKDELYEYKGKTFYGTPWITQIGERCRWAFEVADDSEYMEKIPNCDVLITHNPPKAAVGMIHDGWNAGTQCGSKALKTRIKKGGIDICISGHIHSGSPKSKLGNCICRNVSIVDEDYVSAYNPTSITIIW